MCPLVPRFGSRNESTCTDRCLGRAGSRTHRRALRSYSSLVPRCGVPAVIAHAKCTQAQQVIMWKQKIIHPVGGLINLGFAEGSDLVLVVSHQGRGVYNCLSGERVARDRDENIWPDYDKANNTFSGIGPLLGSRIPTHGLYGGDSLVKHNHHRDLLSKVEMQLWLTPAQGARVAILDLSEIELRAYGFSPTGESFVVATNSDLLIWTDDRIADSLYIKVDRLLWEDWDPIGVNEYAPPDEYRMYVPEVVALLQRSASVETIANHLSDITTNRMELPDTWQHNLAVASKLKQLTKGQA